MTVRILVGDALAMLKMLDAGSVQCCVTSPPYYGLRDYGIAGQLGLEATPDEYVAHMVEVFREVRRALGPDGTLWLNIGDSYAGSGKGGNPEDSPFRKQATNHGSLMTVGDTARQAAVTNITRRTFDGIKAKDLIGIPWMLAFALRADGWYLRQCNIWAKPNGMPESVTDRPTSAHEYVFLLSKSARYFYNIDAARTPPAPATETRLAQNVEAQLGSERANGGAKTNGTMKAVRRSDKQRGHTRRHDGFNDRWDAMEKDEQQAGGSNLRSVWWLAPAQYRDAHFAVMPPTLAEICIVAGSKQGDAVLDPFGGAGTTGLVADRLGRDAILIELNPKYAAMAEQRLRDDAGMFAEVAHD